jgi:hypothetical protein
MKVLNIDKLTTNSRELVLFDKTYKIKDMTVENFIATNSAIEAMGDDTPMHKHMEVVIDMILRSVPDVPREDLSRLSLSQLQAVAAFIRNEDPEGVEQVEETSEEGDAEKK